MRPGSISLRLAMAVCAAAVALLALGAGTATAATTGHDARGTFLLNGFPVFPIVLSDPPPRGSAAPAGGDALAEVASGGVDFIRVGPTGSAVWNDAAIADVQLWHKAGAPLGVYTWVKLRELAKVQPGTAQAAMLERVVTTLKDDAGFGLWKGVDEPWWGGVSASALQYAYCRTTSRGDPSWCQGDAPLDGAHDWVTIQAPRGTAADLQPYSAVTDTHGVDIYPVTYGTVNPDLHQVGTWTQTINSITPNHVIWTTLQICASGSVAKDGTGKFVLPTRVQERYMIYDAIINGARALAFFGGNSPICWNAADSAGGWNWTFWTNVLRGLLVEIGPSSQLYPALLRPNPALDRALTASDPATQVLRRDVGSDVWVIAATSGTSTKKVTISGLPASIPSGSVYTEGRSVGVHGGSFKDTFTQWGVHVYRFRA